VAAFNLEKRAIIEIGLLIYQSGYEPLNLENGSSVNRDNFDATDLRF